eukprot:CAMPEP_0202957950 /NCGR_PEP_ID=MMETSP1396-20130829/2310_1 /ASSEMBLY_ACC=CAM_ASM_000872 /TAXON_ID= /ORGANISM="Pseudokeronopsis sp., Strain Brazil" /LENGTH=145 /DNA_ID=CAMNT_0049675701 /DNA_START=467 /DNA_END=904 /DNA_ORIENTATION=-
MITGRQKQLQEAFRVLKKGGQAAFTVWGRTEHTLIHKIAGDILAKFNVPQKVNNEIGDNPDFWIEEVKKTGFTDVKFWYQACQLPLKNGEDYYNFMSVMVPPMMKELFVKEEVKKEMIEEFDKQCGVGVLDPKHFGVAIILGTKA